MSSYDVFSNLETIINGIEDAIYKYTKSVDVNVYTMNSPQFMNVNSESIELIFDFEDYDFNKAGNDYTVYIPHRVLDGDESMVQEFIYSQNEELKNKIEERKERELEKKRLLKEQIKNNKLAEYNRLKNELGL